MTDKTATTLTSISKIIGIVAVLVGVVTYVSGVGQQVKQNTKEIEGHKCLIEKEQEINVEIQLQLKEIETHLIYIRKAIDEGE